MSFSFSFDFKQRKMKKVEKNRTKKKKINGFMIMRQFVESIAYHIFVFCSLYVSQSKIIIVIFFPFDVFSYRNAMNLRNMCVMPQWPKYFFFCWSKICFIGATEKIVRVNGVRCSVYQFSQRCLINCHWFSRLSYCSFADASIILWSAVWRRLFVKCNLLQYLSTRRNLIIFVGNRNCVKVCVIELCISQLFPRVNLVLSLTLDESKNSFVFDVVFVFYLFALTLISGWPSNVVLSNRNEKR